MKNKITILIPSHNNHNEISQAIQSALAQEYPLKEIIVCDDGSTDGTPEVVKRFPEVKLVVNPQNLGIGKNIEKLMDLCQTRFTIYLCADDTFTSPKVLGDVVRIFDANPPIGVIGCYKYYFLDGHPGAIGVCRDENILTSSCCPSGMAFRKMDIVGTNKIFVEMPSIVAQYLSKYRWTMLKYDTVACRYSPGTNTGTKPSYYTESPTANWIELLGTNYQDFPVFITLKNRAPKLLWREIWMHIKNDPKVLLSLDFYFYSLTAMLMPSKLLQLFSRLYRDKISRRNASIMERPNENNLN